MTDTRIPILSDQDINNILLRMSYQVLEFFYGSQHIHIVGISEGGVLLARELHEIVTQISDLSVTQHTLTMNKELPQEGCTLTGEINEGAQILLVDDVANSGRTLAYALPILLEKIPRNIKIAVLVDRKHKRFPLKADIVGRKLSTNLSEHVIVEFDKKKTPTGAFLVDV